MFNSNYRFTINTLFSYKIHEHDQRTNNLPTTSRHGQLYNAPFIIIIIIIKQENKELCIVKD